NETRLPNAAQLGRIDTLLQQAADYRARGEVAEAFKALEEARALTERSQDKAHQALVLCGLSDGYLLARRLEEARRYAEEGVAVARQAAIPTILATALNHLGNALVASQRYPQALQAYAEGSTPAERSADPALTVTLLTNAIHAHLANGSAQEAIPILQSALTKTRLLSASREKTFGLLALGYLAQRLAISTPARRSPLIQSAYQAFMEARALADGLADLRARAYAFGHLGELYAMEGRHRDADPWFRQALFSAAQADAPELQARWRWQLGRALEAQERTGEAKAAYRKALDHLASIRSALVFGERGNPGSFRETVGAVYLDFAAILLREAGATADAEHRRTTLHEVRYVMEGFKAAELQNYFQDECVTALQERYQARELDGLIGPGVAMLYPIVFPEHTVLLLSLANGEMKQVNVPVHAAELRQTVTAFREQLTRLGNPRRLRQYGLALYERLVKPIAPELEARRIDTLVVVPDDALRTIPFAALYDGRDFLVNRYAFVITPGLTLTDSEIVSPGPHHQALLGGLSEGVQGFGGLPYVSDEIKEVASLYGGTQLLDDAFLKQRVQAELKNRPYSIITFATHARIDSDPRQSFLLTYDGRITLDELERFVRTTQFRDQPVDLMVLSACETAEGDERAALGLAGVAVKAGARSVMASLWSVNDASTARLVSLFFENLKDPKLSKAQALQRAQQRLLADAEYRHPFYWAAFVLIGNWR
ncbi:MAG: CHAT domain-containing protein, partial [Gammaproteobacteria bacterium]